MKNSRSKKFFVRIWDNLLDALFPDGIKCIVCGDDLSRQNKYALCPKCYDSLPFNDGKVCIKCGEKLAGLEDFCMNCKDGQTRKFTFARAPLMYSGSLPMLVHQLKYSHQKYLAQNLGEFLVDEYVKRGLNCDVIIPIPLNPNRQKQRGYNQAEQLCLPLKDCVNIPLDTTSLIRKKDTPTQTTLSKQERRENLTDAFEVTNVDNIRGKSILLVDDIYTTGATMEEAGGVLLKAGAKQVIALSVAHTVPVFMREEYQEDE